MLKKASADIKTYQQQSNSKVTIDILNLISNGQFLPTKLTHINLICLKGPHGMQRKGTWRGVVCWRQNEGDAREAQVHVIQVTFVVANVEDMAVGYATDSGSEEATAQWLVEKGDGLFTEGSKHCQIAQERNNRSG